jgi:hypothetical protein
MNELFLIDTAISKLDFVPQYNKSIKINNKIYVRCHSYFINIYNNYATTIETIDIDEEIKIKAIEYMQPKIYIDNNYNPISEKYNDIIDNKNSNLYICITHADIIIDLDKKNYKIYKVNFNIRKPTEDKYNLFEKIINNINTYYFNINYELMYITYHLSDVINSIYYINTMSITLTNDIDAINIDLLQHTATSISQEIDYKPFIFNEVKLKVVDINF